MKLLNLLPLLRQAPKSGGPEVHDEGGVDREGQVAMVGRDVAVGLWTASLCKLLLAALQPIPVLAPALEVMVGAVCSLLPSAHVN